jgi:hypothetical protein
MYLSGTLLVYVTTGINSYLKQCNSLVGEYIMTFLLVERMGYLVLIQNYRPSENPEVSLINE